MTADRFRFIVRWIFPPLVTSFAFVVIFLKKIVIELITGDVLTFELWQPFLATAFGGAICGLTYSIIRPTLRKQGRHVGDLLTGLLMMDLYFIAIYNLLQYNQYDQSLSDDIGLMLIIASIIGAFAGWYINVTKLESDLIMYMWNYLKKEE
jgi:hypothetical protein